MYLLKTLNIYIEFYAFNEESVNIKTSYKGGSLSKKLPESK